MLGRGLPSLKGGEWLQFPRLGLQFAHTAQFFFLARNLLGVCHFVAECDVTDMCSAIASFERAAGVVSGRSMAAMEGSPLRAACRPFL